MHGDMQNRSEPEREQRWIRPLTLVAFSLTSTLALADTTITPLLLSGDPVAGIGDVTAIDAVVVNDNAEWIVICDTNHPDPTLDRVVLRGGAVFLREGDLLQEPNGSAVTAFRSTDLNAQGESVWYLRLDGTSSDRDTGIYAETTLLIQEGDDAGSPELPAGSTHSGFNLVRSNTASTLLINGTLDVPGEWSNLPALTLVSYDVEMGTPAQTTIIRAGDIPAGEEFFVDTIATGAHTTALNGNNQAAYVVELIDLTSIFMIDDAILVREGAPSPIGGLTWGDFGPNARVDLNDGGTWALRARLATSATTDDVLLIDGSVFVREGASLPAMDGALVDGFGAGPILLAEDDSLLWYVDTDGANESDTALMFNNEVLVREGVTEIDGATVVTIRDSERAYDMSANGRYITAHLTLSDGRSGIFLIDRGGAACPSDLNGSGATDFADLLQVLADWGPCPACPSDIDSSGAVDFGDLLSVLSDWGPCP